MVRVAFFKVVRFVVLSVWNGTMEVNAVLEFPLKSPVFT